MTKFQTLLKDHPEIEQELSRLAKERARQGIMSEEEARTALGLSPLVTEEPPKKRRRRFFEFADIAAL